MKIAIYCRVSTDDQKTDLQLDALRQYSETRGLHIFDEYIDQVSGAKTSRPALDRLLADARRGKFDVLAVWKIDRLGRSVAHLLNVLTELQTLGIQFVSLQEAIDTATPAGRMVFTFLGAVAEFERAIISERVKAGMKAAQSRGKHVGRPSAQLDMNRAIQLKSEGLTVRKIAVQLGVSRSTISRYLSQNP